jgi:sugar phosphate isomerase/epimerase
MGQGDCIVKIAIIPTTGDTDPYQGMQVATELQVEGLHIPAFGGGLDLESKTSAERAEILKRIREYRLEVSALIGWGGGVDLGEEVDLANNIAWGKRINETAADMAEGLWMAHVGIMPDEETDPKWTRFVNALGELAHHGEKIGATLALETGPEPPRIVRKMIESIGSPAIRVNFDPANLLLWPPILAKRRQVPYAHEGALRDYDPVEGLRILMPFVVHVHAKDAVVNSQAEAKEVVLGTGMTRWPELHRMFEQNRYEGYYAIERECGENAMGDVRAAVRFLQQL